MAACDTWLTGQNQALLTASCKSSESASMLILPIEGRVMLGYKCYRSGVISIQTAKGTSEYLQSSYVATIS